MTDNRSSSALFKRAEQLERWEESDTNKQSTAPKRASRIQFSSGIEFLAACTAGDKEEVHRLLKTGADINTANVDGLTALHQACIDDNLDMVEFLVSNGADVNCGDNEGWTPLHATASCGFVSIARYLLDNGADIAAVNYDGDLPVDIAESDTMANMLQAVIDEKGVDCKKFRNAEVDKLMADSKIWAANGYVEVRDPKTGGTPLHVAAAKGYLEVAKILLEDCNAEPDCVDYEGWTPLHAAALWGQKEAIALLLKYGADPIMKNHSGQTCMDLVDPAISTWLTDALLKEAQHRGSNNNNKHVDIEITGSIDNKVANDKPPTAPEIIKTESKPPKGRAPSPEVTEPKNALPATDDSPSWRRSASFRNKQLESPKDNSKISNNNVDDTTLRRTHSFENDKTFYQRYRDVTARIKASSCPSIPPLPQSALAAVELREKPTYPTDTNEDVQTRGSPIEKPDWLQREANSWTSPNTSINSSSSAGSTTTKKGSPIEKPEWSPREANSWTSPNTSVNSSSSAGSTTTKKGSPIEKPDLPQREANSWTSPNTSINSSSNTGSTPTRRSFVPPVRHEESETQRKVHAKRARETRRSTQGVTFDEFKSAEQLVKKKTGNGTTETQASTTKRNDENTPPLGNTDNGSFELEDAGRGSVSSRGGASSETTVTLPLRRAPAASTANTTSSPSKDDARPAEEDKERESSVESKPSTSQAALNVIQRRRRPKRRCTGVGIVDMDDIMNERGGGGEGENDTDTTQSGSERTEESEDCDYKAMYLASADEIRRLRALLNTSEQQLRDARSTITRLTQVNQNSLSEIEKREKRAMERKLSEMEEELKNQQALQAENQRLKDENGALIRVISKLSK